MHKTEGQNHIINMFQNGPPGTRVEEDWLNSVQEELVYLLTKAGISPLTAATDTRQQIYNAIREQFPIYDVVQDYDAVGDGSTDDTTAIRAALDVGGIIVFRHGLTFRITGKLSGSSNTIIIGYGAKIELDTASNVDLLEFLDKSNVHIFGLEVDGKKSMKTDALNTGRGIHLHGITNGSIIGCTVHDTFEHGIRVGGDDSNDYASSNIVVEKNHVYDCGIYNVTSTINRGFGIWIFWRVENFSVKNNYVHDNHFGGIHIDDASSGAEPNKECLNFSISNNVVLNNNGSDSAPITAFSRGIGIEGCREFTVVGNIVLGHSYGLLINDGQGEARTGEGALSENTIDATNKGIYILDSENLDLSNNNVKVDGAGTVYGINIINLQAGIACKNITISGGSVRTSKRGISTWHGSSTDSVENLKISGVQITTIGDLTADSGALGIHLHKTKDAIVINNSVKEFYEGLNVSSDNDNPIIKNNIFNDNGVYGMHVGDSTTLIGNYTEGNTTAGIKLDVGSNPCYLANNIGRDTTPLDDATADTEFFGNDLLSGTLAWDPGNLVDGAGETSAAIAITGVKFGMHISVAAPYDLQGILAVGYVSSAGNVKIRLQNETGGAINLVNGEWKVRAL